MNKILKIKYKDFSKPNELVEYLKNSNYNNIEIEFDKEEMNSVKNNRLFTDDNTPFNGYCNNFITTSEFTETSLILKRKNFKEFILRLNVLLDTCKRDSSFLINTTKDLTEEIAKLRDIFKDVSDSELEIIIKDEFGLFFFRGGVEFNGCKFRLSYEPERITLSKTLTCEYAVEFFSSRNVPKFRLFTIDKKAAKSLPVVSKDICTLRCELSYKNYFNKLEKMGIKEKEIFVLPTNEFNHFYSLGEKYLVKITDKMIENWWNEGSFNEIIRYDLNIENTINWFGVRFIAWEDVLVNSNIENVYVSEDITVDEFKAICKDDYIDTRIGKAIKAKLDAKEVTPHTKTLVNAKLSALENDIQRIIDENKKEVVLNIAKKWLNHEDHFLESCSLEKLEELLNSINTGLDCGFLYFKFHDTELDELFNEAVALELRSLGLNITLPISLQSTTIKADIATEIVVLIKKELGISIRYWTLLD